MKFTFKGKLHATVDATHKKLFFRSTLGKIPQNEAKSILFLFGRRDNIKRTKWQKSAINFVLFHRGKEKNTTWREWKSKNRQKYSKSHLDFSDLIMEIESIIFYTCYEINIVVEIFLQHKGGRSAKRNTTSAIKSQNSCRLYTAFYAPIAVQQAKTLKTFSFTHGWYTQNIFESFVGE